MEKHPFMEEVYPTPKTDAIMKELGWDKPLEEVPVFVQDSTYYNKETHPFVMTFPSNFHIHYGSCEKLIDDGKEAEVRDYLSNIHLWTKMFVSQEKYDEMLYRNAIEFYQRQWDLVKVCEWEVKYQEKTGKPFKLV
jgi:hypothetical protein